MKQKNRKHKKSRGVLYKYRASLASLDLEMYKEAMRLERERRKSREFFVI